MSFSKGKKLVEMIYTKIGEEDDITDEMYEASDYAGFATPEMYTEGTGIYIEKCACHPERDGKILYVVPNEEMYNVLYAHDTVHEVENILYLGGD